LKVSTEQSLIKRSCSLIELL